MPLFTPVTDPKNIKAQIKEVIYSLGGALLIVGVLFAALLLISRS
tara:strand:+ start:471 stop:605 length:135 start_codon:yes stop_codon:yes gene_type:complete